MRLRQSVRWPLRLPTAGTAAFAYDAPDNLQHYGNPHGNTRNWYDASRRLLEVAHRSDADLLSRFSYQLDAAGNRTAITAPLGTVSYPLRRPESADRVLGE